MIPENGKIRALVIDVYSFTASARCWGDLAGRYMLVYAERYPEDGSILLWRYDTKEAVNIPFSVWEEAAGPRILMEASRLLSERPERIGVISADKRITDSLLSASCATFGCGGTLSFPEAHRMPDYYLPEEGILIETLKRDCLSYPGEAAAGARAYAAIPAASVLSSYGFRFPLYVCGRYFGKDHFRYGTEPYSQDLSRIMHGEPAGETYQKMLKDVVSWICRKHRIDAVLSVPPKPGEPSRFSGIVSAISEACGLENRDTMLFCCRSYPSLWLLSAKERKEAVEYAFKSRRGYDYQKTFLILDDVVSTGATFSEIAQTLLIAGAEKLFFLAMAAVQNPVFFTE